MTLKISVYIGDTVTPSWLYGNKAVENFDFDFNDCEFDEDNDYSVQVIEEDDNDDDFDEDNDVAD